MATVRVVKYEENSAGRVGDPNKEFNAGVRNSSGCPPDCSDLHGLVCRKALKDGNLPAALLRLSAQIRTTIVVTFVSLGPQPRLYQEACDEPG